MNISDSERPKKVKKMSGSNLVAAGIFLSRIAGLLREQVLALVLGGGPITDSFRFAMRIPNLLQNLLGEGSLSASFIPVYSKLLEEGKTKRADDLAKGVLALLTAATSVIVFLLVLLARPIVWLFTPWEKTAQYELTIDLVQITSIGIGFLVVSAWCLGVLNSHRKFFLSYVAPVIWNVTQIAVLLAAWLLAVESLDSIVLLVAWSVVAGGLLQLVIQLPVVRRLRQPETQDSEHVSTVSLTQMPELKQVLRRFLPAVSARGIVQISSYADTLLAVAIFAGALASYTFALPLYLLPISLFGFSVAAAELAEMSRFSDSHTRIAERLIPAMRKVLVPAGFITAAYLAASRSFIDTLYGWPSRIFAKEFTQDDVLAVSLVLTAFALALPAIMTARVTQNTLYSLGEVKGPARIAGARLLIMVTTSALLMFQLDWFYIEDGAIKSLESLPHWPLFERVPSCVHLANWETIPECLPGGTIAAPLQDQIDAASHPHLGVVGLALGGAVASWAEWAMLRRMLSKRLGTKVASGWARPITIASLAAAAPMFLINYLDGRGIVSLPSPIDSTLIVSVGAIVYIGALHIQNIAIKKVFSGR